MGGGGWPGACCCSIHVTIWSPSSRLAQPWAGQRCSAPLCRHGSSGARAQGPTPAPLAAASTNTSDLDQLSKSRNLWCHLSCCGSTHKQPDRAPGQMDSKGMGPGQDFSNIKGIDGKGLRAITYGWNRKSERLTDRST